MSPDIRFPSSRPAAPPSSQCLEFDFWTDFYASSSSDLYLDNRRVVVVPEPGAAVLLLPGVPVALAAKLMKGRQAG